MIMTNITDLATDKPIDLKKMGSFAATRHRFDKDSLWALETARVTQRPLLLRGEPGIGKSQLAHAAAWVLNKQLLYTVVNAETEAQDLLYHFDSIERLADAQARTVKPHAAYMTPGIFWWAFDYQHAKDHNSKMSKHPAPVPETPEGWQANKGSVVLIDEIDKAPSELPNALLEVLGNQGFRLPYLEQTICAQEPPPLVLISTNEERELPAAFVRRCLVLNFSLPSEQDEFIAFLAQRGQDHYADSIKMEKIKGQTIYQAVAALVYQDRQQAAQLGMPKPGQAEYLDTLKALGHLAKNDTARQDELLQQIQRYTLHKYKQV